MSGVGGAPLVIDCDPGCDDAAALLLTLASPELDLQAVTCVSGNVPIEVTTANARRLLDFAGAARVPVHAGAARPWLKPPAYARHVHGDDGLAGAALPPPGGPPAPGDAVAALVSRLRQATPPTLMASGPLSNVASALVLAPDIAERTPRLLVMGGALAAGNVTPHAEFNFWVDPHAARAVLEGGFALTLVPLDLTMQVCVDESRRQRLAAAGRAGALVADMWAGREEPMHDACLVAVLLAPALFTGREMRVAVDTEGEQEGRLRVRADGAPAMVLDAVDAEGFFELVCARLATL